MSFKPFSISFTLLFAKSILIFEWYMDSSLRDYVLKFSISISNSLDFPGLLFMLISIIIFGTYTLPSTILIL